jgi:hypothetical protein
MEKLKCKIIKQDYEFFGYIVIDKYYKIISNGISSSPTWVINDAGGYHTKNKFDKLYGENNWEVDFSDMYSDESDKISGKIEPNICITMG